MQYGTCYKNIEDFDIFYHKKDYIVNQIFLCLVKLPTIKSTSMNVVYMYMYMYIRHHAHIQVF